MTPAEGRVFEFIGGYIRQYGYGPTYQEIADGLGWSAKSRVARVVCRLEKEGRVRRISGHARAIEATQPLAPPSIPWVEGVDTERWEVDEDLAGDINEMYEGRPWLMPGDIQIAKRFGEGENADYDLVALIRRYPNHGNDERSK